MPNLPSTQVPGVHHRRLGDLIITTVSDGYLEAPLDIAQGVSPSEAGQMIVTGLGRPGLRMSVNVFAIRSQEKTYLIDTGSGVSMGPSCGRLLDNLAVAGIAPEEISAILLTHIHPDHSNGLTSDSGQAQFPNAGIIVHADELAHWFNDTAMAATPEPARTRTFVAARFQLAPYRDRIRTFRGGEVLPGITGVPCPGHTPGHSGYRISSAGEELLIWGDIVHVPEWQVPRPDITLIYDTDPAMAAASRRTIFDLAVRENLLVGGMHLHFPGYGRVVHRDGEHKLLTEPWAFTL